jgi:hypothetical protein
VTIPGLLSTVPSDMSEGIAPEASPYLRLYIEGFDIEYLGFEYSPYSACLLYSYYAAYIQDYISEYTVRGFRELYFTPVNS